MEHVGIRELKARLSEYLYRVREGETLAVTDRGKTIARISPAGLYPTLDEPPTWLLRDPSPGHKASGGTSTTSKPPGKSAGRTKSKSYAELLRTAQKASGHRTERETVTEALDAYVRRQQRLRIAEAFGQIEYAPDYDYKKQRRRS